MGAWPWPFSPDLESLLGKVHLSSYSTCILGGLSLGAVLSTRSVIKNSFAPLLREGFSPIESLHPSLTEEQLTADELLEVVRHPAKMGVFLEGDPKKSFHRAEPYLLKDYKISLLKEYAQQCQTEIDAQHLLAILQATPDPELKLEIIKVVRRNCCHLLSDLVSLKIQDPTSMDGGLMGSTYALLARSWGIPGAEGLQADAEKLKLLKPSQIFRTADKVSQQVAQALESEGLFLPTLQVFVRLSVLRHIKEAIADNLIPQDSDQELVGSILGKVRAQITKFRRLEREAEYNPEFPTIGLEIQPGYPQSLNANMSEINRLIKYLPLDDSLDKLFECVLPPTRSPISQLMMVHEILLLIGIPTESLGVQINFGGFGTGSAPPELLALQRLILGRGRLRVSRNDLFTQRGPYWALRLAGANKGEVNTRTRRQKEVKQITPEDPDHPEFGRVAELRASVGADSFCIFARELLVAYQLAGLAKAAEKERLGYPLSAKEQEMAEAWGKIKTELKDIFKGFNLPEIDRPWTKEDWKNFAECISGQRKPLTPYIIKTVQAVL